MDKLESILKKKFDIHPSIVFKLGNIDTQLEKPFQQNKQGL